MKTCVVCKKPITDPDWRGETCMDCESRAHQAKIKSQRDKELQHVGDIAIALFDKMKSEGYIVKP